MKIAKIINKLKFEPIDLYSISSSCLSDQKKKKRQTGNVVASDMAHSVSCLIKMSTPMSYQLQFFITIFAVLSV